MEGTNVLQSFDATSNDNSDFLKNVEISVSEAEKRSNGSLNIRDYYTVYLIETRIITEDPIDGLNKIGSVWRRYTEFEQFRSYLEVTYPYIVIPPLPEKRVMLTWQKVPNDTFDPDFVDRRRAGLENFLLRVASHTILCRDKHFYVFLQQYDRWKETLNNYGMLQQAEAKLKCLTVSVRLKDFDTQFESIKNYSDDLQSNIGCILKQRALVADRIYTIHKLHAHYGRVFSEWSVVESPALGDCLQKAGHYLDTYSTSIDTVLDDEEVIMDQLKEYLFFSNSLLQICRHYDQMLLNVESITDNIHVKNEERCKAEHGVSGFMSRLFGAVETEEARAKRIEDLDKKLRDEHDKLKVTKDELYEFKDKALVDIERFKTQKNDDLQETLMAFAVLQLKSARKNLQLWTQIRDSLTSIP